MKRRLFLKSLGLVLGGTAAAPVVAKLIEEPLTKTKKPYSPPKMKRLTAEDLRVMRLFGLDVQNPKDLASWLDAKYRTE